MIWPTMALAAVGSSRYGRAEQARDARFSRLVALILDTIFIGLLTSVATAVFGVTQIQWWSGGSFSAGQASIPVFWTGAIWIVYYVICEAMFSATPGKAMNGLRVVTVDGSPLSLWSVLVRNVLRLIDALPAMYVVGGVAVMATAHSQRLGDLAGGTTVVFARDAVEPGSARSSGRTARITFALMLIALTLFTAGFDYFFRPVLVVQSAYNEQQQPLQKLVSYSLGTPTRTFDTVTYPISARSATASCSGYVKLTWAWLFGWQITDMEIFCPPGTS